jgi:18S rRNA (guanine1575-N7)-methyltransferase
MRRGKFLSIKELEQSQCYEHIWELKAAILRSSAVRISQLLNMSRPEDTSYACNRIMLQTSSKANTLHFRPPELYYNDTESRKYTTSSRIKNIQSSMTMRALELLDLSSPSLILDVGCGSGLSGEILSSTSPSDGGPHVWIGMDISACMLDVALQRNVEGDLLLADIGQGVPFRAGTFDAAISISAIQWLCNAESSEVSPTGRLARFFNSLYASLKRGGRAVCQFYPKNDAQRTMISTAAVKAGFGAGILEDDPGTKNSKLYLVLTVGGGNVAGNGGDITGVVQGMDGVDIVDARRRIRDQRRKVEKKGGRTWILRKKEQMERKGKVVKATSKYTGRNRGPKF